MQEYYQMNDDKRIRQSEKEADHVNDVSWLLLPICCYWVKTNKKSTSKSISGLLYITTAVLHILFITS